MLTKNDLTTALHDSLSLRALFRDPAVIRQLRSAGIETIIYELHSPAKGAKKYDGLGVTLCGRHRAMRSAQVTCKKCLNKLRNP